jgi:ABC-2 type transport system ATP-binding protein
MQSALSLQNVTKRYGKHTALDDVSLEVPRGVVFALLGENGAGKTTAIKLLLGLEQADAGRLEVMGLESGKSGKAIRRQVGYVPERPALYEWMSAGEIGWFAAGFYPAGYEHEYRKLLDAFRVPHERKIHQMSKGMRAKVALSLALAHEPELLILDEPTSGLDTLVRREFLESMVDIAAAGRTVFLSSHLIPEVERVADMVAIVREGKLLAVESLDKLKCHTRELTITVDGASLNQELLVELFGGEVIHCRRHGRQFQALVRGFDEAALEALRARPGVVAVESRTPGLEDIFVAYMQADRELEVSRRDAQTQSEEAISC